MVNETKKELELTPKQDLFARNLFSGMSQRDAWINAGYSHSYPMAIVDVRACELAAKGKIKGRVAELRAAADNKAIMTVVERKIRLSEFGRANLTDFIDTDGNIKLDAPNKGALSEITIEDWQGGKDERASSRTKKIKLRDPVSAIAELNKMERIYSDIPQYQDNRQYNILVADEETGQQIRWLMGGGCRGKADE